MDITEIDGKLIVTRKGDIEPEDWQIAVDAGEIAWDIETSGLDWRTEKIGTCQLDIGERRVVLVNITDDVPARLRGLLSEGKVKKVFHHAMFDLRFMSNHWDVDSQNIACTKIASKLLRVEDNRKHTLKDLLRCYLDVEISKAQRLSDWLSRELTTEQIMYAVEDVVYLKPLLMKLECALKKKGLQSLATQCFAHIPTRVRLDIGEYPDVYEY